MKRTLGRSGIEVSALGLGCWAIGGPFWKNGLPVGWGQVDDAESIHSIRRALDLGVTFFDTAAVYGCGHSEEILGKALAGRREEVIIATNFTVEGEATAHYVAEMLAVRGLKVTRIARGLPVGGELEHVDSGTLAQSVIERRPID